MSSDVEVLSQTQPACVNKKLALILVYSSLHTFVLQFASTIYRAPQAKDWDISSLVLRGLAKGIYSEEEYGKLWKNTDEFTDEELDRFLREKKNNIEDAAFHSLKIWRNKIGFDKHIRSKLRRIFYEADMKNLSNRFLPVDYRYTEKTPGKIFPGHLFSV